MLVLPLERISPSNPRVIYSRQSGDIPAIDQGLVVLRPVADLMRLLLAIH